MKYFIYDNGDVKEVATKEEYDSWEATESNMLIPEVTLDDINSKFVVSAYFDGKHDEGNEFKPFIVLVSLDIGLLEEGHEDLKEADVPDEFWSDGENFATPYATFREMIIGWDDAVENLKKNGGQWPKLQD
jgi:hypothetical protein